MRFYPNDVALVAYSGAFPECETEESFFEALLAGKCMIRDLREGGKNNPVQVAHHFPPDQAEPSRSELDFNIARHGSRFSLDTFRAWCARHRLDLASCSVAEIVLHELISRLNRSVPGLFADSKNECVIGLSTGFQMYLNVMLRKQYAALLGSTALSPAQKGEIESYLAILSDFPVREDFLPQDMFETMAYQSVRKRFQIGGPCSFVDAACASSLAAVMTAVHRVRSGECDLAITGGIEAGLSILTLICFSQAKVLSPNIMNPFDKSADGMNQGEGAALFALTPLARAKALGWPVHAVIRGCDGSSDGIQGAMFEPTERGQILAYERAYRDVPSGHLSYLECHGTGTAMGDKTELLSTAKFFHPLPPIGSVKANIGHTIGAAGAASLLKGVKMIEKRIIPKMPRFQEAAAGVTHVVPTENRPFAADETLRLGISSFGFGGTNFHLVMDQYRGEPLAERDARTGAPFQFVLNGRAEVELEYARELYAASRFKIPPKTMPQYDRAILGGVLAAEKLFKNLNLNLPAHHREKIGVLSTSNFMLQRFIDASRRVNWLEFARRMRKFSDSAQEVGDLSSSLPVTEDTMIGALKNLIAGRITKDLDLRGVSFNIAAEKASLPLALSYARCFLARSSGAYLIISIDEALNEAKDDLTRSHARAWLVSDLEFALEANLPIEREIASITSTPLPESGLA